MVYIYINYTNSKYYHLLYNKKYSHRMVSAAINLVISDDVKSCIRHDV